MGIIHTGGVKKEKDSTLVPLAVIIAALAGLLISIVTARASFPVYLYYLSVICLLVAIFSLFIYGFLAHPVYDFIKKRREIRKHNTLSKNTLMNLKTLQKDLVNSLSLIGVIISHTL